MTGWQTMTLDERILSIAKSERYPRYDTFRDQLPSEVSDNTIRDHLRRLVEDGRLVRRGPARSRRWELPT